MPKVSIAIPTRNRSAYLKLAVASALGQSLSSIEVVVSDNASDDNTQEVLRGIQDQRLVCIRQDRPLTMAENWNCCLQHATGEYFLLLSDDDFLETDAIQEMAAVFEQGSLAGNIPAEQIGIVHCATAIVDAEGRLQETLRPHAPISAGCEIVESFLRRRFTLFPCAVLLRRNDLVNLGGYPGDIGTAVDSYVWMSLVLERGYAAGVPEVRANYRKHPGSLTNSIRVGAIGEWIDAAETLIRRITQKIIEQGRLDEARAIRQAGDYYVSSVVSGMIVQMYAQEKNRRRAWSEYFRRRQCFSSISGRAWMIAGMLRILLPTETDLAAKEIARKLLWSRS